MHLHVLTVEILLPFCSNMDNGTIQSARKSMYVFSSMLIVGRHVETQVRGHELSDPPGSHQTLGGTQTQ